MIRETARVIDQTVPHQLVVAKVLGALNCTDLLRVIKTEGPHPFAATTEGMADMRGTADIVVSFDGGFKWGLAIEVKTTRQTDEGAGPFQLFKAVKNLERNQKQFDRLIGSTPAWWYIVVHIGKLTAKTVSGIDRALLDCPAAIFEGQHADATPDEVLGVKPLGELLDLVSARIVRFGMLAPLYSPQGQLDMLDDVPVVTLDTPLKSPVLNVPLKVVTPAPVVTPASIAEPAPVVKAAPVVQPAPLYRRGKMRSLLDLAPERVIEDRNLVTMTRHLIEQWDRLGEAEIKARASKYPEMLACYERLKGDIDAALRLLDGHYSVSVVEYFKRHDAIWFSMAVTLTAPIKSAIARNLMPEATFILTCEKRKLINLLGRVGYTLLVNSAEKRAERRKA